MKKKYYNKIDANSIEVLSSSTTSLRTIKVTLGKAVERNKSYYSCHQITHSIMMVGDLIVKFRVTLLDCYAHITIDRVEKLEG
jgi:hypothetical protein